MRRVPVLTSCVSLVAAHLLSLLLHWMVFPGLIKLSQQNRDTTCFNDAPERCPQCSKWSVYSACTWGNSQTGKCCKILTRKNSTKREFFFLICTEPRIDGGPGEWHNWVPCSSYYQLCTKGAVRIRSRVCDNPIPRDCGRDCDLQDLYDVDMGENCEPRNGGWGEWTRYSECPANDCTKAKRTRTRRCNRPRPSCSGRRCPGKGYELQPCTVDQCCDAARHGWTEWSSYGDCSKTCGVGTQQKSRTCKAGSESPCSALCTGGYTASRTCTVGVARDGGWSAWQTGPCQATCGSGVSVTVRLCTNPAPDKCGSYCPGPHGGFKPCSGLPSCCANAGKTGMDISIIPKEVTITGDKPSAMSIVQCKAITCGGDDLRELRLHYKQKIDSAYKTEYAAAKTDSDGGRVVDKVGLSYTSVVGSIGVGFINYIFLKVRCDDAGYYSCTTTIRGAKGQSQNNTKTEALKVTVNAGRFTLTPEGFVSGLNVGDALKLKCSGSVGMLDYNSQVDIVWEYQDKDSSTWNKVQKPDVATITSASPGNCSAMTEARVLTLILTSYDIGRTYRCFLRKTGVDLKTNIGDDGVFTVNINARLQPVARTFLRIQPDGVLVDSIVGRAVTVTCRAIPSLNPLTTLVVSHRPMRHNGSVQPRELAVTDTDDHVAHRARLDHTVITGGLADRLISYKMLEVTCDNAGVYYCTSTTTLATSTATDTDERTLDVRVEPYRSTLTPRVSGGVTVNSELKLQCSTLTTDPGEHKNVRWQWQYTTDPDPKTALWTDMDSSALQTITTRSTTTASKCFNISTTTLTLQPVSGADFGKSYRCYVINGNTEYVQRAAVYKLKEDTATAQRTIWDLAKLLGAIFGGLIGLGLLAVIAYTIRRKYRDKQGTVKQPAVQVGSKVFAQPSLYAAPVRTHSVPSGIAPVAWVGHPPVYAQHPQAMQLNPSPSFHPAAATASYYDDGVYGGHSTSTTAFYDEEATSSVYSDVYSEVTDATSSVLYSDVGQSSGRPSVSAVRLEDSRGGGHHGPSVYHTG